MKMKIVFLYLLNTGIALGRLVEAPINAAVIAGQWMSMTCRMEGNSGVRKWDHFNTTRQTSTAYIRYDGTVLVGFGVEVNDMGSGFLYANATNISYSGIYTCLAEVESLDRNFNAHLVVFESEPVCETNLTGNVSQYLEEGDRVWMRCTVNFSGFWPPKMEWTQHWTAGDDGRTPVNGSARNITSNNSITSELIVVISSQHNGSFFTCRTYFDQYVGNDRVDARNVPSFNYNWTSDVIRLRYTASQSVQSTVDPKAISSETSTLNEKPPTDFYFTILIMVTGFSILLVLVVIASVASCIHYKRQASGAKHETAISASLALERVDNPLQDNYEDLPYVSADNYERIEEIDINEDNNDQPHRGPLPTAGYSPLSCVEPILPSVYIRMEPPCERPAAEGTDNPIEGHKMGFLNPEEKKTEKARASPYLELVGVDLDASQNRKEDHHNAYLTAVDAVPGERHEAARLQLHTSSPYRNIVQETPEMIEDIPASKSSTYTSLVRNSEH